MLENAYILHFFSKRIFFKVSILDLICSNVSGQRLDGTNPPYASVSSDKTIASSSGSDFNHSKSLLISAHFLNRLKTFGQGYRIQFPHLFLQ